MEDNRADQIVVQVRWGPGTNRPTSPPQPLWQGSPPPGVKKVLTRDALDKEYRDRYAKWATNFVLLTDEFLDRVVSSEWHRIKQLNHGKCASLPFVRDHYCTVGDDYLWVRECDGGCTVELCYPDVDPDERILAIENMPVMCPSAVWALRLAWASYPNPPANLVWRSYW
jgi:hypothetical protein